MLFESLDKLKRNSILSAILMVFLGAIILVCPQAYISALTLAFGYTLVIIAIVLILNFLSGKKSLMEYLKFTGALILGLVGIAALVYRSDIMRVLTWLFGFLLVLDGGRTLFHSLTYARRSQRKGWWVLTVLSVLLIATGIVIFVNPFWNSPDNLMKVIGGAVFFSAIVSGIRLIWTWPVRNAEGGNDDGRE